MEQRAEIRFAVDQPVNITVLNNGHFRGAARVRNVSPSGLQLVLDRAIPAGSPLKMELDNTLALGEVIYCQPEGEQCVLGVKLEHVLNGLAELSRVLMEFADQPVAPG